MKLFAFLLLFCLILTTESFAQITFKAEYFGQSAFRDEHNMKVGNSKGSAIAYHGAASIPLLIKQDKNSKPIVWGLGLNGTYASLNNKNFTDDLVLSEILNLNLGIFHMRSLNDKWSLMASIGAGVYAPDSRFSKINFKNVLGNVGVMFIRHINPNLEIGGGLAMNNTFGYPMVFPAFCLNWNYNGRYTFNVSAMEGFEMSAGYKFKESFSLKLIAEVNGQMALLEKDGKDVMFTHQYIVVGLRPEIKINKLISIPITAGFHAMRTGYFNDRSLKGFFKDTEYDPYFQISPYISASIKIEF